MFPTQFNGHGFLTRDDIELQEVPLCSTVEGFRIYVGL